MSDPVLISWINHHWWVLAILCFVAALWERYQERNP
jgi:hypothetical protein